MPLVAKIHDVLGAGGERARAINPELLTNPQAAVANARHNFEEALRANETFHDLCTRTENTPEEMLEELVHTGKTIDGTLHVTVGGNRYLNSRFEIEINPHTKQFMYRTVQNPTTSLAQPLFEMPAVLTALTQEMKTFIFPLPDKQVRTRPNTTN